MNKNILKLSVLSVAIATVAPTFVSAHGYMVYPKARQVYCDEQGGAWNGAAPNPGCRAALAESGAYAFYQKHEYAALVAYPGYEDIEVVKQTVTDGSLCSASDPKKAGMSEPRSDWTRTTMSTGEFEVDYRATAPHNPHFFQFYLSKPGTDLNKPLGWDDFELIQEHTNIPSVVDGWDPVFESEAHYYRMNVTIPADRSGDAVLFSRWQRNDPVGEGFYNCSDITITGDGGSTPPPDVEESHLQQISQFIPDNVQRNTPKVGEAVQYNVYSHDGNLHTSFSVRINEQNREHWDSLLAAEVSGYYEDVHKGAAFIGLWTEEYKYTYHADKLHGNYFYSIDDQSSARFSITPADEVSDVVAVITPSKLETIRAATVKHGETVYLHPHNSKGDYKIVTWNQISGPDVNSQTGLYNDLIIETSTLATSNATLSFELTLSNEDGTTTSVYSFDVVSDDYIGGSPDVPDVPDVPDAPIKCDDGSFVDKVEDCSVIEEPPVDTESTWNRATIYDTPDVVTHGGRTWTAQWWTRGEEPGTTGQWGAWR